MLCLLWLHEPLHAQFASRCPHAAGGCFFSPVAAGAGGCQRALAGAHSYNSIEEYDGDAVILEKTGKFVKGKYAITGGSVGMFEGKKIGRAKNLEKLQAEIIVQSANVAALKLEIQAKHNEEIGRASCRERV